MPPPMMTILAEDGSVAHARSIACQVGVRRLEARADFRPCRRHSRNRRSSGSRTPCSTSSRAAARRVHRGGAAAQLVVDAACRNRPRAAASRLLGDSSLLEARPPRSNSGELKPAYSQSTSHSRLPSSMKLAGSRSLWPNTISIGPTAPSSAPRAREIVAAWQGGGCRLRAACARSRARHGTPRTWRRAAQVLRNLAVTAPDHVDQALEIGRVAHVLRREGAALDEIEDQRCRALRAPRRGPSPRSCAARLAASSFARTTAVHRDVAADPHDVAAAAILDPEIVVGDAAGERLRLHRARPDRQLGDARRRPRRAVIRRSACASPLVRQAACRGRISRSAMMAMNAIASPATMPRPVSALVSAM